jgi:hypothetical protein
MEPVCTVTIIREPCALSGCLVLISNDPIQKLMQRSIPRHLGRRCRLETLANQLDPKRLGPPLNFP